MRIGIIGTRGIPNHYGGFEQFTMYFAEYLTKQGYEVFVYNSRNHPYKEKKWNEVNLVHIYDPENKIGTSGQFVYDLLSILNARKKKLDVIFQLGYTSSSIWGFLFPKKAKLITNMDGMEWKRAKYGRLTKKFLQKAEKWAVKQSDELISDSVGIQEYIKNKYNKPSYFIAYGANVVTLFDSEIVEDYNLTPKKYNVVIARLEPENNIEPIIIAHLKSNSIDLIIIGNDQTKYGTYLKMKYSKHSSIRFLGSIYNKEKLDSIRHYSNYYLHGHSVGGTNPSLLEAMACGCSIVAHKNTFNKSVLNENCYYFDSEIDLQKTLEKNLAIKKNSIRNNIDKILSTYSFEVIHTSINELITKK